MTCIENILSCNGCDVYYCSYKAFIRATGSLGILAPGGQPKAKTVGLRRDIGRPHGRVRSGV